jgi:AMMECR1 domain-containing protein
VNDLIALIPEDGSRISKDQIRAALEQEAGEPLSDAELKQLKSQVMAMGFAESVKAPAAV